MHVPCGNDLNWHHAILLFCLGQSCSFAKCKAVKTRAGNINIFIDSNTSAQSPCPVWWQDPNSFAWLGKTHESWKIELQHSGIKKKEKMEEASSWQACVTVSLIVWACSFVMKCCHVARSSSQSAIFSSVFLKWCNCRTSKQVPSKKQVAELKRGMWETRALPSDGRIIYVFHFKK